MQRSWGRRACELREGPDRRPRASLRPLTGTLTRCQEHRDVWHPRTWTPLCWLSRPLASQTFMNP